LITWLLAGVVVEVAKMAVVAVVVVLELLQGKQ